MQFFINFSPSNDYISKKRILPDMCYKSNFSSNLGLKSREFWEKSLEPFLRKWPKHAWPYGHFLVFRPKCHVNLILSDFIGCHLKASLNTFPTIPIFLRSLNWFGHSGHGNVRLFLALQRPAKANMPARSLGVRTKKS